MTIDAIAVDLAKARRCVVCGAKVRQWNPLCVTCDPVCTRARHEGRTRDQQIRQEMLDAEQENLS